MWKEKHNKECDPFCTSNILTDYLLHHHSLHSASLPATVPLTAFNASLAFGCSSTLTLVEVSSTIRFSLSKKVIADHDVRSIKIISLGKPSLFIRIIWCKQEKTFIVCAIDSFDLGILIYE